MTDLRSAGPQDVPAIRALVDRAYGKWVPLIGRKPWPMRVDYAVAVTEHNIQLLHIDGVLAGLVETIRGEDFVVENLAVSPDFQKRGTGGMLLGHAERNAAALGYDSVRLYTNKRFKENIAFYRRRGYRIESEEQLADSVLVNLRKRLPSASAD
ncbi:MAG TPA: GNAT family N-acetyltransferase [Rhizomicrobium sp.]|jgi:ribosomal protein S18 acetylase RimI-like enzyme